MFKSQGFTKVLDTGQLLRKIANKACVGKRARDNAITRAALSQSSDNFMDIVQQSVLYMQSSSRLTPDNYYKTILDVTFDWIATSPSGREMNRRVEIHHHHHGTETSRSALQSHSHADSAPISLAIAPPLVDRPTVDLTVDSPTRKKKRIRVRFTTFALRDQAPAPWQCPYSEADCKVCSTLWQRRYRCNKHTCAKHHLSGAHTDLNRAEEKFVRAQHPQFKISRKVRASDDDASPSGPVSELTSTVVDEITSLQIGNSSSAVLDEDCSAQEASPSRGVVKHTLDWVAEVEEKRGRV